MQMLKFVVFISSYAVLTSIVLHGHPIDSFIQNCPTLHYNFFGYMQGLANTIYHEFMEESLGSNNKGNYDADPHLWMKPRQQTRADDAFCLGDLLAIETYRLMTWLEVLEQKLAQNDGHCCVFNGSDNDLHDFASIESAVQCRFSKFIQVNESDVTPSKSCILFDGRIKSHICESVKPLVLLSMGDWETQVCPY